MQKITNYLETQILFLAILLTLSSCAHKSTQPNADSALVSHIRQIENVNLDFLPKVCRAPASGDFCSRYFQNASEGRTLEEQIREGVSENSILAREPRKAYLPSVPASNEFLKVAKFEGKFPQRNMTRLEDKHKTFEVDGNWAEQRAMKRRLLKITERDILQFTPSRKRADREQFDLASREVLDAVVESLTTQHPDLFEVRDGIFYSRPTGEKINLNDPKTHPLKTAGLLVQEDLVLVKPVTKEIINEQGEKTATTEFIIDGGFLSFPANWSLHSALGKNMAQIHLNSAPKTPGAYEGLVKTINGVLSGIRANPEKPMTRNNWNLYDDPTLAQPNWRRGKSLMKEENIKTERELRRCIFLRTERQVMRALPQSGYVLFTIKTFNFSMDALRNTPGVAPRFLNGLKDRYEAYPTDIPPYYDVMVRFLGEPAGHPQPEAGENSQ